MKASLARALEIANKIDGDHIVGIPEDDPIKLFHSIHGLRHLAVQFREALDALAASPLCKAAERLVIDIKDNDYDGAVALHAGLVGIGHRLQDLVDDQGDDPIAWRFPDPAKGLVGGTPGPNQSGVELDQDRIAALIDENQRLKTAMSEPNTRHLGTLRRIILAMAKDQYGYVEGKRNSASTDIQSAVQRTGQTISDDCVRDVLREAAIDADL